MKQQKKERTIRTYIPSEMHQDLLKYIKDLSEKTNVARFLGNLLQLGFLSKLTIIPSPIRDQFSYDLSSGIKQSYLEVEKGLSWLEEIFDRSSEELRVMIEQLERNIQTYNKYSRAKQFSENKINLKYNTPIHLRLSNQHYDCINDYLIKINLTIAEFIRFILWVGLTTRTFSSHKRLGGFDIDCDMIQLQYYQIFEPYLQPYLSLLREDRKLVNDKIKMIGAAIKDNDRKLKQFQESYDSWKKNEHKRFDQHMNSIKDLLDI